MTVPIEEAHARVHPACSSPRSTAPTPGLAEENLQARIRGTLLMAISNKFDWMVLTTGNKSEMATGLQHALRRHGRRLRGDQGRARRCSSTRSASTATGAPAARSSPRPCSRSRRARSCARTRRTRTRSRRTRCSTSVLEDYVEEDLSAAEIEAEGFDRDDRRPGRRAGRPQRVQAPPGAAGHPGLGEGVRQGPPTADHQSLVGLNGGLRDRQGAIRVGRARVLPGARDRDRGVPLRRHVLDRAGRARPHDADGVQPHALRRRRGGARAVRAAPLVGRPGAAPDRLDAHVPARRRVARA